MVQFLLTKQFPQIVISKHQGASLQLNQSPMLANKVFKPPVFKKK